MGLAQMSALTGGKKFRRPYVEEINARTKNLPALYQQRKTDQYRDKQFGLEQQGLALREDALDEQKKAQKRANRLGYANIGLGAGLGVAGLASDNDWFKPSADAGLNFPNLATNISSAASSYNPSDFARYDVADIGGGVRDIASAGTDLATSSGGGSWWKNLFDFSGGGGGLYNSVVGDYMSVGQI